RAVADRADPVRVGWACGGARPETCAVAAARAARGGRRPHGHGNHGPVERTAARATRSWTERALRRVEATVAEQTFPESHGERVIEPDDERLIEPDHAPGRLGGPSSEPRTRSAAHPATATTSAAVAPAIAP